MRRLLWPDIVSDVLKPVVIHVVRSLLYDPTITQHFT
jgi:hypothetical protein